MPCHGRPARTRRMLECLGCQTKNNFELVLVGDGCLFFNQMTASEWFRQWRTKFTRAGNLINITSFSANRGGYGSIAINYAITIATGRYTCWANNDDMLQPEHVEFYYNSIACHENKATGKNPVSFVYNDTMLNTGHGAAKREPELKYGCVGHSELIVATAFLRSMPEHQPVYGQDWELIENMMTAGTCMKGKTPFPTYYIMSTPSYRETGID